MSLVEVIRCKDCGYYREDNRYCMGLPTEPPVCREPNDFCSKARKSRAAIERDRERKRGKKSDYMSRACDVFYERFVQWLKGEIEVHGQEYVSFVLMISSFDFETKAEAIEYFSRYIDDGK